MLLHLFCLLFVITVKITNAEYVSKISTRTSTIPGSGMDSGSSFVEFFSGGGRYSLKVCQNSRCCETGRLNTEDDNWELGQVDWFVGKQIGGCNNFKVSSSWDNKSFISSSLNFWLKGGLTIIVIVNPSLPINLHEFPLNNVFYVIVTSINNTATWQYM